MLPCSVFCASSFMQVEKYKKRNNLVLFSGCIHLFLRWQLQCKTKNLPSMNSHTQNPISLLLLLGLFILWVFLSFLPSLTFLPIAYNNLLHDITSIFCIFFLSVFVPVLQCNQTKNRKTSIYENIYNYWTGCIHLFVTLLIYLFLSCLLY